MVYLLLFFGFQTDATVYSDTAIYQPLTKSLFSVTPDGEVYILDRAGFQIHRYGNDGKKLDSFGAKGQGPGEFEAPAQIGFHNEEIWVLDFWRQGVSFFDRDGRFLRFRRHAGLGSSLIPTETGWVYHKIVPWGKEPAMIATLDPSLRQPETLLEWVPEWTMPTKPRGRAGVQYFNPAKEFHFIVGDPAGRFIYVGHTGSQFKISVVDCVGEKQTRTIYRPEKAVPFNRDWGEEKLAEINHGLPLTKKLRLNAPSHFPILKGLDFSPEGTLVVELWTAYPDNQQSFVVMDSQGREGALAYKPAYNQRVLGVLGDWAYVAGYTFGEAIVYKTPLAAVDRVCESHPVRYQKRSFTMLR